MTSTWLASLLARIRRVWFADDATAGGSLIGLYDCWCRLKSLGPSYGYASKTWLIVKPEHFDLAGEVFRGTGIRVTSEGKRHLGACIGSQQFTTEYVNEKVRFWTASLLMLSKIDKSHPHVAYCAYVHGLANK